MRAKAWLACTLMACLVGLGCPRQRAVVPVTTSSEEALQLYLEGRDLLETLEVAQARRAFEQAVERDPNFALAHLFLATSSTMRSEFFESLRRAVRLSDEVSAGERRMILGIDAGAKGSPAKQLELYEELVRLYPDDERAQVLLGRHHFDQQDYLRAVEHFDRAIELNPEYAPAYDLSGRAKKLLERHDEAEQAFKKYVELVPSRPEPYADYADLLTKMGRFDASIEMFEKALALEPGHAPSRVGIGNNLILLGRPDEARTEFRKLLDGAQDDDERRQALFWTAVAFVHEEKHEQALVQLGRSHAIAEATGDVLAASADLDLMGDVLLDAGAYDRALSVYGRAFETVERAEVAAGTRAAAHRNLLYKEARVAVAREDLPTAKAKTQEYQRAVSRSRDPAEKRRVSELAGMIELAEGAPDRAMRTLAQADSGNPRILYLKALVYRRSGHGDRARRFAEKAANAYGPDIEFAFVRNEILQLLAENPGRPD